MPKYPFFISALHEEGQREQCDLEVFGASPDDAVERALQQYLPRFGGLRRSLTNRDRPSRMTKPLIKYEFAAVSVAVTAQDFIKVLSFIRYFCRSLGGKLPQTFIKHL
jgi:hypothetical protein